MNQNKKKTQIKHIVRLCSTLFLLSFSKQVINILIQSMCQPSDHYIFIALTFPHIVILLNVLFFTFFLLELNFLLTRTNIARIYCYNGVKFKS